MKNWMLAALMAVVATLGLPEVAEAKRLGGGKSLGMQRSAPATAPKDTATPPTTAPATPAATAAPAAAGAAAAAAPRRSWMGPIAGLAAGLGLAALMSHLGFGDEMASFLMMALLAVAVIFVVRLLMRRFAGGGAAPARQGMQFSNLAMAGAGAGGGSGNGLGSGSGPRPAMPAAPVIGSALQPPLADVGAVPPAAQASVPADFDSAGFERIAKMIFIRMQAANDSADLNDLRQFTTPELFAALRMDLLERGPAAQQTDVVQVDAQVLDVAEEADQQVVSVGFRGLVREEAGAEASAFDEVWHLVKPRDDSRNWAIAGIQSRQ